MNFKKSFLIILLLGITTSNFGSNISAMLQKEKMESVMKFNRESLLKIDSWIDESALNKSLYHYGVAHAVQINLLKPLGNEITYSDVITYLSKYLKKKVNYLELGVSVGKNFFQVANYLTNNTLVGFDIEEINPILEKFFINKTLVKTWNSTPNTVYGLPKKKDLSSLTSYDQLPNNNKIYYLSGDVLDENSWKQLAGMKFNLIFSDAVHFPQAILFEQEMIEKYNLLDEEEFVIVWDDLGGIMTAAFNQIFQKLSRKYNLSEGNKAIISMRGWIGINEKDYHQVGIIMKHATQ